MQTLCFPCCMLLQLMIQKSDPLLYHSRAFIMSQEVFVRRLVAQGSTIRASAKLMMRHNIHAGANSNSFKSTVAAIVTASVR